MVGGAVRLARPRFKHHLYSTWGNPQRRDVMGWTAQRIYTPIRAS